MNAHTRRRLLWQVPFLAFLIIGSFIIVSRQNGTRYQKLAGEIFSTTYHIIYQCPDKLDSEIMEELQLVDNSLSPFNDTSIITHVNRNEPTELNDLFTEVFSLARKVSQQTDGAFDITVAPLVNAWGFGFKNGLTPDAHTIDSLKTLVGYDKVDIVGSKVRKQQHNTQLDCSAIAKGYACDRIARLLKSHDVENFMVEIGGELVTQGVSEKRVPWRVGVNKPVEDPLNVSSELQTILNVTNVAMATSGNYRNFYYKDGRRYAHTIDPKTGHPVEHSLLSATVLARTCAEADAYATAFMVMGMERAKAILEKHPELMAYFIYSDKKGENSVWFSPKMEKKIVK